MTTSQPWQRCLALADMNAFFASVEQYDRPDLRGRPVAVTNGERGTCIITCSYEARAVGVKTGMRLLEARRLCPDLIQCPARPKRYATVSSNIMSALQSVTPDVEIFSVDEAFLDLTRVQHLWGTPETMGRLIKKIVLEASGIHCSVGISGDKTTAKWAAKQQKPDGLTIVPPWEAEQRLKPVPVTDLCGVARGIGEFLASRGVLTCGDMHRLPIGDLGRRYGNPGRRVWLMAQAKDPEPLHMNVPPPKSIGHGKVMPPNCKDRETITIFLIHMAEKVAARLRRHRMAAKHFTIALRTQQGWIGGKYQTVTPCNQSTQLVKLCHRMIGETWHGEGVFQCLVTATDPTPEIGQLDLFSADAPQKVDKIVDSINHRFGEFAIAPARLLGRSDMPNVISPAWKPSGHRETILD